MTTRQLENREPKARPIRKAMRKVGSAVGMGALVLGFASCSVLWANRYGIGAEYRAQVAAAAAQRAIDEGAAKVINGKINPSNATCAQIKHAINTEIQQASVTGVLKEPLTKDLHDIYIAKSCARS